MVPRNLQKAFAVSSLHENVRTGLERLFFNPEGVFMANEDKLQKVRHSMSHVMAEAVLELFPTAQIAIGPAIENGFYYDFELPRALTTEDLETISEHMKAIIHQDKEFKRIVVSRAEAAEKFKDQKYKLELLAAIPEDEEVTLYNQGAFTDLCRGPHVKSTKELNAESFKLLSIADAYLRGNEKNPMLQRIYATARTNPKDLRLRVKATTYFFSTGVINSLFSKE